MNNKKGYTLPELLVLIVVIGVVTLIALLKTSYAFKDNSKDILNNYYNVIKKQAVLYGEDNKDKFNEKNEIVLTAKTLAEASYLPLNEDGTVLSSSQDMSNVKILITLKDDKVTAKILK